MCFFALLLVLFFPSFSFYVPFRQSAVSSASSPAPSPSIAKKIPIPGVSNAGKVSDSLLRGAQPHIENLEELQKLGVTTIVDLRRESPQLRERERQKAESLGIHFVSIPVPGFSPPTSQQLAEYFTLLRQAPLQRVFVHCQYGEDRTGVFIAAYRIAFEHWTADQAYSEMLDFGFNHHWHPSMVAYIRSLPDRLHSDPTLRSALGN
jgi:tyrosine-protein phosphatase SIW14